MSEDWDLLAEVLSKSTWGLKHKQKWYCPACGELSEEKVYLRHNGFVPIFVCPKCAEKEREKP